MSRELREIAKDLLDHLGVLEDLYGRQWQREKPLDVLKVNRTLREELREALDSPPPPVHVDTATKHLMVESPEVAIDLQCRDRAAHLINVRRWQDEPVFQLVIYTSSEYPSVDVIRKTRGKLIAASVWEGTWETYHYVRGNHSVTAILDRSTD